MRQLFSRQTLLWAVYAALVFLMYHLLVKPAFLDFSWIALLVFIPLALLLTLLLHPAERRQVVVFTLGFLLLDYSFTRLEQDSWVLMLLGGLVAALVVAVLAATYGRLRSHAIAALILVAVLANLGISRDSLAVWHNFTIQWTSDKLYEGEWVDYFPITLYDVNHDGKMEIITYGNADEMPDEVDVTEPETDEDKQRLADKLLFIRPEPVSLYAFSWRDGNMVRIPESEIAAEDLARIREQMPEDYPGFPYYTMKDGQLIPNVQRQSYMEGMMQAGTSPYRAFLLDMQHLSDVLAQNQGRMDAISSFGPDSKFADVAIRFGRVEGTYDGKRFAAPTKATKLVDAMRLPGGREGLILIGEDVSILTVLPDGSVREAYRLDRHQAGGLATAELIAADVDRDGADELLIANTPSYIIKPLADGSWQILWASLHVDENLPKDDWRRLWANFVEDKSFRFSNVAVVGDETEAEIIAKTRSWVSTYDRRYLTGFRYTPDGLVQTWRMYLPLINVQVGDIDGDQANELVANMYGMHRIYVFDRHGIPVLPIVSLLFAALIGYGIVRRIRHAKA